MLQKISCRNDPRCIFVTVCVIVATIIVGVANILPREHIEKSLIYLSKKKHATFMSNEEKDILSQELKKHLSGLMELELSFKSTLHSHTFARQVDVLREMLMYLQHGHKMSVEPLNETKPANSPRKQEVCPEKFVGKDLGYGAPYYREGFALVKCKEFVPINELITLLLHAPIEHPKPSMSYLEMMQELEKYYPGMQVILATEVPLPQVMLTTISKLKIKFKNEVFKKPTIAGAMWSKLLGQVGTPYVLIAPYITHFDDDINLHRLVRMLSYNDNVAVAGGSYRNLTGHWVLGCHQDSFKYWTAQYSSGYYRSFNECVVCDYLSGPFVAKTQTLKKLTFDSSLSKGVFLDLFWRLKLQATGNVAVVCADIMFNIDSPQNTTDAELAPFANKHNIKKMVSPDGAVHWFGCKRGLAHTKDKTCSWSEGIGAPPCDLDNLGDIIRFTMTTCEQNNMICEYAAKTVLGAVKFASVTPWPWEKDTDIHFDKNNFTAFRKLKTKFEAAGFTFKPDISGLGKFEIFTKKFKLSLHGRERLDVGVMLAQNRSPTRVPIGGAWVTAPRNPGLLSRNHYGREYFRHAEHDGKGSLSARGAFRKCPLPGHSACLDQYSADGNMQFLQYLP